MPIIDDIIVSVGTQRESYAGGPTGFRRLTPSLLQADHAADDFDGLPDGVDVPSQLLAALKAAAPRLGLSVRLVHAVDWLFRFTREEDWEIGSQPIVWPSACLQQEALGLSKSGVQSINRSLIEAGLVTMKDSPNGKRYGIRDGKGRIIEAYGFDLSPIAARYGEFVQAATEAKAERELIRQLRRRATIARKGIIQILETAAEYEFEGEEWSRLRQETRALVKSLRAFERSPSALPAWNGAKSRHVRGWNSFLKRWKQSPRGQKTAPTIYLQKQVLIFMKIR
jgi:replication initiation protein RepC